MKLPLEHKAAPLRKEKDPFGIHDFDPKRGNEGRFVDHLNAENKTFRAVIASRHKTRCVFITSAVRAV
jgi:hypothetical protein